MKVCKNIKSSQYFIYLSEVGVVEILLVTPNAEIKLLKKTLFTEIKDISVNMLSQNKMISKKQVDKFYEYEGFRGTDIDDNFILYFEQLSTNAQMRVIKRIEKEIKKM